MNGKILVNKARCKKCNDVIESTHVHDFVTCKCSAISVDGGKEYLRRVAIDLQDIEELSEMSDAGVGEDDLFEIPEFLKKPVLDTTKEVLHPPQEALAMENEGGAVFGDFGKEEKRKPRREYKFRKDVAILKGLGWTQSQLNKLDRHKASDYAAHRKEPPPKYSRIKVTP